jgi:hypothetical protein
MGIIGVLIVIFVALVAVPLRVPLKVVAVIELAFIKFFPLRFTFDPVGLIERSAVLVIVLVCTEVRPVRVRLVAPRLMLPIVMELLVSAALGILLSPTPLPEKEVAVRAPVDGFTETAELTKNACVEVTALGTKVR